MSHGNTARHGVTDDLAGSFRRYRHGHCIMRGYFWNRVGIQGALGMFREREAEIGRLNAEGKDHA